METSLHIPDKIKCLTTVAFGHGYDCLVLGTESQIVVFDTYHNSTVFQRDIPDGVNCFTVGRLASNDLMVLCGGNCAIWGFNEQGRDVYWTVTGDAVTCMCLTDFDGDGELELVIGSPDHEIRVFKDDLMRTELVETDAVVALTGITDNSFVYALANGTLGIYQKDQRLWRIKSKHTVSALVRFPNDDLFTCVWKSGKMDLRSVVSGEAVATRHAPESSVVAVAAFPANLAAVEPGKEIAIVTQDGKVQGFLLDNKGDREAERTQEQLRDFGVKKHNLLLELSNFEQEELLTDQDREKELRIPANTYVESSFVVNLEERTLFLKMQSTNQVPIKAVVAFAEGMFNGDSYIWVSNRVEGVGDEILLPLIPEKDSENDVSLRVFLGYTESYRFFVFESFQLVPRFARFALLSDEELQSVEWKRPEQYVEYAMKQRPARLLDWVRDSFTIANDVHAKEQQETSGEVELCFIGLEPQREAALCIEYDPTEEKLRLYHDVIETLAAMIQSMAKFFALDDLEAHAVFPKQFKTVEDIVAEIDAMYEVRDRLTTELSEKQSFLKEIIVRAEDATVIEEIDLARKYYMKLRHADRDVRQAFLLRSTNNERFVSSLRNLNKMIEHASKLRVGEPSRAIVSACRDAISEDNKDIIVKILEFGA